MTEYHLEFLQTATDDLERIADYYIKTAGVISSKRVTDRILDTLERLKQFPYLGSLHPDPVLASMKYRRIISGEYVCVYRIIDHSVTVYRIVHGSTDYPKYFYQ